jgi:hypothetical protein
MGRAKKVTGPFVDNMGIDMLQGGGKLFLGSGGRFIGPGHFGLLDLGGDVQKFSCHYEADLDRGGVSVLDIRPLLWRDGWLHGPAPRWNWPCRECRSAGCAEGVGAVAEALAVVMPSPPK